RPVDWSAAPFSKLQTLPRDGRAVTSWSDRDSAFASIIADLRSIIHTLNISEISTPSIRPSTDVKTGISSLEVEITIDRDFNSYTLEDQNALLRAIGEILKLRGNVNITRKTRGSVKLRLRLSTIEVIQLYQAIQNGELRDLDVVNAEILLDEEAQAGVSKRPTVFIGSSQEGITVAETIQVNLDELCEVTLWSQGVFGLGQSTLEALVNQLDNFDFAILVLTPDDLIESRGELRESPRDNILFELGLFIGRLGRERTFTVYDRTAKLKLPSDIAGVTPATYQPHSTGNLEAALGAPCTRLKRTIMQLGPRNRP